MTQLEEMGRSVFFEDAPILTQDQAHRDFVAWHAGSIVRSEIVAVGTISLTEQEQALMLGRRLTMTDYHDLDETSPLAQATTGIQTALQAIAWNDSEHCGLRGIFSSKTYAGNYRERRHAEPWHSDNYGHPSVRWTVAFGIGSTDGAVGHVSRADINSIGDLLPHVSVAPGGQLEPVTFQEGTVVRFMNTGAIHCGPAGNGGRIMAQATLALHP